MKTTKTPSRGKAVRAVHNRWMEAEREGIASEERVALAGVASNERVQLARIAMHGDILRYTIDHAVKPLLAQAARPGAAEALVAAATELMPQALEIAKAADATH